MRVEMMGTEAERTENKCTEWIVSCDARRQVRILHRHGAPTYTVARLQNGGVPKYPSTPVFSLDFSDALAVARKMLGVKP